MKDILTISLKKQKKRERKMENLFIFFKTFRRQHRGHINGHSNLQTTQMRRTHVTHEIGWTIKSLNPLEWQQHIQSNLL